MLGLKSILVNKKLSLFVNYFQYLNLCSLISVPRGPIIKMLMLAWLMAWHESANKPLPELLVTQYTCLTWSYCINSLRPDDIFLYQWMRPPLVKKIPCCLIRAEPVPKPMLTYCPLYPLEQTSLISESKHNLFSMRMHLKMSYVICGRCFFLGWVCPGGHRWHGAISTLASWLPGMCHRGSMLFCI